MTGSIIQMEHCVINLHRCYCKRLVTDP